MAVAQNLLLDSKIRDWVLFPLLIIMIFVGILRHYVMILMRSTPKIKMSTLPDQNAVVYCQHLVQYGKHLSPEGFKARLEKYIGAQGGYLKKKVDAPNPMEALSDPSMTNDMMKNNMVMMVPNMGMMALVSAFFSGFIIAKFPFALSARLRAMVQKGVDIDNLDCSYVTSLSMYLLMLFGLQGITTLLLGDNQGDEAAMMQAQMGMGQQQKGPVDYGKMFKQLTEELEFEADRYRWIVQDSAKL
jgi:hypothetical protein